MSLGIGRDITSLRPVFLPSGDSVLSDGNSASSSSDTVTLKTSETSVDLKTTIANDTRHRFIHEQLQVLRLEERLDPRSEKARIKKELLRICDAIIENRVHRFDVLKNTVVSHRDELLKIAISLGEATQTGKDVHTNDKVLRQAFKLVDLCKEVIEENKTPRNAVIFAMPIESKIKAAIGEENSISRSIEILEGFLNEPPIADSHKHLFTNLPLAALRTKNSGKFERWFYLGKGKEIDPITQRKTNGFFFMKPIKVKERDGVEYKFVKEEKMGERPLLLGKDKFVELTSESTNPDLSHFRTIDLEINQKPGQYKVIGKTHEISKNQTYVGKYVLINQTPDGNIEILQNIPSELAAKPKNTNKTTITTPRTSPIIPSSRHQQAQSSGRTSAARTATARTAPQIRLTAFSVTNFLANLGKTLSSLANSLIGLIPKKIFSTP